MKYDLAHINQRWPSTENRKTLETYFQMKNRKQKKRKQREKLFLGSTSDSVETFQVLFQFNIVLFGSKQRGTCVRARARDCIKSKSIIIIVVPSSIRNFCIDPND